MVTSSHAARAPHRPFQHRHPEEGDVLLGTAGAQPAPVAAGGHDERETQTRQEASLVNTILPEGFWSTEVTSTETS